uniref:Uncharacterized protein n=1 Tax=Arundo donax TaxID=35708 RepID=A0A0A9AJ70_ARUDO
MYDLYYKGCPCKVTGAGCCFSLPDLSFCDQVILTQKWSVSYKLRRIGSE